MLRRPQFSLLIVRETASQIGQKLNYMALIALVGARADPATSSVAYAHLAAVTTLPMVFGPLAGALVDRWNRQRTMIVCDLLRAALVGAIPWLYRHTGQLWPVYIIAFVVALLGLFFNSAKMAIIPDLVVREELFHANAALTSIGRVATVVGIVGGGVIIGWGFWSRLGWSGYEAGFYVDAAAYLVSVAALTAIAMITAAHARRAARHLTGHEAAEIVKRELQHVASDVRATLGLIRTNADLRFVLGTVALLAVLAASIYVVMVPSVQTMMGQGTRGVGYLGGLLASGMVVGSLLVGTIGARWNKRHIITLGLLVMGAMMIVGSALYTFPFFVPVSIIGGLVLAPVMVSQDTFLHEAAPRSARGLIFSTRDLILGAVFMGCALAVGYAAPLLGRLGADEPFRLALGILGVLISATSLFVGMGVVRGQRSQV